jgi:hypothetical protein
VRLIIIIKLFFIYYAIYGFILERKLKKDPKNVQLQKEYHDKMYFKERLELMFKFFMSLFLIYVFFPQHATPIQLNSEMRILLYLFGFILLLTAKWSEILDNNAINKYLRM